MKPLNYAILKYFTTVDEANADEIIFELKDQYGSFRGLKKKSVVETLMTAKANGILEETRYDLDEKGELRIYYRANKEGRDIINKYIN